MRLFGYYALHSFINQLKKLFKTWVLIFIVMCGLIGGLIGYGAAKLSDVAEERNQIEEDSGLTVDDEDEFLEEELPGEEEDAPLMIPGTDLTVRSQGPQILELGVFLFVLFVIGLEIFFSDKSGAKIFLMADVNLLFSAPMKPQSVLMFRLMTNIGTTLLMSLYLAFQLPNLIINLGMSSTAAIAMIITWVLTFAAAKLAQVLFYTLCSNSERFNNRLTPMLLAVVALIGGSFIAFAKVTGLDYYTAAVHFFNAPVTRWVPIVGWLKGFMMYAYEGNFAMAALEFVLVIVGGIVMTWLIWQIKADFYEEALAHSEEVAVIQQAAKDGQVANRKRKKERSDRLRKTAIVRGQGAQMFFVKSLANRRRFATLGFFTKTTATYLIVTVLMLIGMNEFFDVRSMLPVALALGVFAFYRTLGNPLEYDTEMPLFVMIPEKMWEKLFYSTIAGTVNCLLDLLPSLIVAAIVTKTGVGTAAAWLLLILTVDFFGTTTGTFINLSVPGKAGDMAKQFVQIMFIYFGLLPDIAVFAIGLVLGHPVSAMLICAAINIVLGVIFLLLSQLFIEPRRGKTVRKEPVTEEVRLEAKKQFSRVGLILGGCLILMTVLQLAVAAGIQAIDPELLQNDLVFFGATFLPIDLIGMPLAILLLSKLKTRDVPQESKAPLKVFDVVSVILIAEFLMYAGNLIGALVTTLIGMLTPSEAVNPLLDLVGGDSLLISAVFMVILAPILEELVYRKGFVDAIRPYGERNAVLLSGLMFGLFHGNFSQFFYAFGLGLLFAYIYNRTGKIRYTIFLHMGINFLGSVLAPKLMELAANDLDVLMEMEETALMESGIHVGFGTWAFLIYIFLMICAAIAGLVVFFIRVQDVRFATAEKEPGYGQRFRTIFLNPGMLVFIACCVGLFAMSVIV